MQEQRVRTSNQSSTIERERDELWVSLHDEPRQISSRWFYDALGSALFDAITQLPEYYPTRCELALLRDKSLEAWSVLPQHAAVVELGSGNADKALCLLDRLPGARSYHPIDVSYAAIDSTLRSVTARFPQLRTQGLTGDFCDFDQLKQLLASAQRDGPAIIFFPGGTIGNFSPAFGKELLSCAAEASVPSTCMLLGVDHKKSAAQIEPAYNDSIGLTAAFNRNALAHLNRQLGVDFEVSKWRHQALYNEQEARIEMWLYAQAATGVTVGERELRFAKDEGLRTECSYKYDRARMEALVQGTGWSLQSMILDPSQRFAHALLTV